MECPDRKNYISDDDFYTDLSSYNSMKKNNSDDSLEKRAGCAGAFFLGIVSIGASASGAGYLAYSCLCR
jgi:hypothetical protein